MFSGKNHTRSKKKHRQVRAVQPVGPSSEPSHRESKIIITEVRKLPSEAKMIVDKGAVDYVHVPYTGTPTKAIVRVPRGANHDKRELDKLVRSFIFHLRDGIERDFFQNILGGLSEEEECEYVDSNRKGVSKSERLITLNPTIGRDIPVTFSVKGDFDLAYIDPIKDPFTVETETGISYLVIGKKKKKRYLTYDVLYKLVSNGNPRVCKLSLSKA
jgi:hypothetical protein